MSSTTYKTNRSGVVHEYILNATVLQYHADGRTLTIPYSDLTGIEYRKGANFYLSRKKNQPIAIWLEDKNLKPFMSELFRLWGAVDKGTAAKAALDFSSDDKYIGKLWLALTIAFPGMLAILLSADAYQTYVCNNALLTGKLATAEILKVSKNRRANFVWRLKFTTETGQIIQGRRTPFFFNETGHSLTDDKHVSVVYSPENLSCWDVSMRNDAPVLNLKNRGFTLLMTGSFGFMFALVSLYTGFLSIARLRRVRPLREEIEQAGKALLN